MSTEKTVYVGRSHSECVYHADKHCRNGPENPRPKQMNQIPNYRPCGFCSTQIEVTENRFECSQCGAIRQINSEASAKPHACTECESVTRHNHIHE